ncbi:MAG: M28 family peptidase, partial [Anaerolineales bacterium]|nr:M28 family peptidase [Anaerolineales bacterium]
MNKYTLAAGALLMVAFFWFRGSTGSIAVFTQQVKTFDGQKAMEHLEKLTDPAWQGRDLGSDGLQFAAEYIADEFKAQGLQPAGESMTYFQTRPRSFEALDTIPYFSIDDISYQPVYHQDYVEYVARNRNLGTTVGQVRFLGMGNLMEIGQWFRNYPALDGLDYSGEVVMVLSEKDAAIIEDIPKAGLLVVTEEPMLLSRINTLSYRNPFINPYETTEIIGGEYPKLRISETVANHLLAGTGYRLKQLRYDVENLKQDEFLEVETNKSVTINITGTIFEKEEAVHVIGHLPGTKSDPRAKLDNQLIVVLAQYDTPPLLGGEARSAGANDNASGVAVMLEMIRTMRESGYQPNKTFLFVAYSGEGLGGGEWFTPDISKFLQAKYG